MARASRAVVTAIAALVLLATATTACTVLSGIDDYEVRKGSAAPAVDDASPGDGTDAAAAADAVSTVDAAGSDAGTCATAADCQEERCRSDLPDSRLDGVVGSAIGVTATCTAGIPHVIAPGPNHYYGAAVRCTLAPQPTAAAVSSFVSKMNAAGWYGYSTQPQTGGDVVVVGEATTGLCSGY